MDRMPTLHVEQQVLELESNVRKNNNNNRQSLFTSFEGHRIKPPPLWCWFGSSSGGKEKRERERDGFLLATAAACLLVCGVFF